MTASKSPKGNANGIGFERRGGGLYADDSAPTIRNVRFVQNSADERGGAAYFGGSHPDFVTIEDCVFNQNTSNSGAAIRAEISLSIQDCEFTGNTGGPALLLDGDGIHAVSDSTFHQNSGVLVGAVRTEMDPGGVSIISDCLFTENEGEFTGAIYYTLYGNHELRSSRFFKNEGDARGGGVTATLLDDTSSSVRIENSLFTGNTSNTASGAIMHSFEGDCDIINCSVVGNTTSSGMSAGVMSTEGTIRISNTILWDNVANTSPDQQRHNLWYNPLSTAVANRSIIQHLGLGISPPAGANNSATDPRFVDADGNDNTFGTNDDNVRLMPGSPAIDAGSNLFVGPFIFADIYSSNRYADDTGTPDTGDAGGLPPVVDIGAAEFQGTTPTDCLADVNGDGMLSPTDFTAWVGAFNSNAPECDQNNDGMCTPTDFTAWVGNYNTGC